jgi:NhaP-type Na+/H+ or K+/H+ antiporter
VTVTDLAIIAGLVFVWGTLSARLERFDMTAPIVFTVAGVLLTHGPLAPLGIAPSAEAVKILAELTLTLVLFSDASRVGLRQLQPDRGLYLRLLGIGLPVSIGLGTLAAFILPGVQSVWLALLIGAALAPTDAALGAPVMVNRAVPARIRRLINIESGLNDGIATPIVMVAIAGLSIVGPVGDIGPGKAVAQLALGLLAGAMIGGGGGWLIKLARGRGWVAEGFAGAAVLGLALCCYASSVALDGNGFIAAFIGGLAFTAAGGPAATMVPFVEETGALFSLLVWLVFGAVWMVPSLQALTWQAALYAVLSLTVVRMLPVALALAGTGLGRPAALFIGWFGPRGLASIVFGLIALEELAEPPTAALTVIAFTVLLSVLAHGLSADPLAKRYGPGLAAPSSAAAGPAGLTDIPERRLIRHAPDGTRLE